MRVTSSEELVAMLEDSLDNLLFEMNAPPVKSAANLFIIIHVVYSNTKKMADKSRLDTAVVFLTFVLNTSVANLSGFVR